MTTPPNSEPPNEPPNREAVEAAMRWVLDDNTITQQQMDSLNPDEYERTDEAARILAAEVQRLRALVDEPQGFRNAPPRAIVIHDEAETLCDGMRKQIKPGPDKPKQEPDLYCGACGQPSAQSLWFEAGYTATCPVCGAEYVCKAGK